MKHTLTATGCAAVMFAFSLTVEGKAGSAVPCADPATNMEYALISKSGPGAGRVRITGIVTNDGKAAWKPTTSTHRLRMVLGIRESAAVPGVQPLTPPVDIALLAPGQQYRIDHQVNWNANPNTVYPRYSVQFFDAGKIGTYPAAFNPNCRKDNDRREITATDINTLFQAPLVEPPLKVLGHRLLGGIGINTIETTFAYRKKSANEGKISASVAAPYRGAADEVPLDGNAGSAKIHVHIPCDDKNLPHPPPASVSITYRLWGSLSLPGGAGWVPGFSVEQTIPYRELCAPGAPGRS